MERPMKDVLGCRPGLFVTFEKRQPRGFYLSHDQCLPLQTKSGKTLIRYDGLYRVSAY
jgi:hypothetical protein